MINIIRLSKPDLNVMEFHSETELIAQYREDAMCSEETAIKHLFHLFTGEDKYRQNTKYAYCLRGTVD